MATTAENTEAVRDTAHVQAESVEGVEADPNFELTADSDNDSALGSDNDSTRSASITSSITGYKYENGRRYHAYREGAYLLPNDEREQSRLDLIHHVFRLSLGGNLFVAPIKKDIQRVLDIGTGTGIWAIDFAEEYPNAEVVGTDLSPIQPTWVPPNLKFYVDDVEDDWAYRPEDQFDFIHDRSLSGSIKDWPRLMKQCYDNLKPGGYCELQEYEGWCFSNTDPTLSKCPDVHKWALLLNEGLAKLDKEFDVPQKLKGWMVGAGFEDVKVKVVNIPCGPWAKGKKAKEMGMFHREDMCDAVDSFTPAIYTRLLGWSPEEVQVFMAKVKQCFRDPRNQIYTNFWFVYGRKPET